MAINLKDLYDQYSGNPNFLTPVKGNTPLGYYNNDPEFTNDALGAARYVAQRLGVTGRQYNFATKTYINSPATLNITDLTVYAAFEEAVTTYGNLVYQYKIRDNYINIEGSDTLPFFKNLITYVNSVNIGAPITWSAARLSTWDEIGRDAAYSESIDRSRVYAISASAGDFIAPNFDFLKSFNLADNYITGSGTNAKNYNLSSFVYNQFNRLGGATYYDTTYSPNSASVNFSSNTSNDSIFSITGSNGIAIQFKITSSIPDDTLTTYYIPTGSTSNDTANNIARKLTNVSYSTFGTTMLVVTESLTPTTLDFTSSLSSYNIRNFKKDNVAVFTNVVSSSVPVVPEGNSHVYFYVTTPLISSGSVLFNGVSIPTVFIQSNIEPALNGKLLSNNLTTITSRIASDYGAEANVGGNYDVKKGFITLQAGVQDYDLNAWALASASLKDNNDTIEIRKVFYEAPPAIVRYFDPYAGTGTGIQSLLETFGFGQMSPGINFLLQPIFFDVMKVQAIEFNDQIRKAAFSFDLKNNQLKIFPIPTTGYDQHQLYFEYVTLSQKSQVVRDQRTDVVTDIMNVPYRNPIYSQINAVGRLWILKYCLALCREIEAHIRIQFSNLSIGGVGPLQGNELIADARTEKQSLIEELKEMLNEVSRKSQLERKQQESQFTRDTLTNVPTTIYIM
jgi:hypothetical protein